MATQFLVQDDRKWKSSFFTIWGGQALSLLGSQLVQFALIWYITIKTGSATALATATLVGILPQVLLGPLLGSLVDRWNRRIIMIVADTIIAGATAVLAVLFLAGTVEIWHIYLLSFVRSLAGGFHGPAMLASTSLMVPKENLTRIQGINQLLNGGLNIISAPLGAIMLEILPMQSILAIDVISAAAAIVPLFFLAVPQPERIEKGLIENETKPSVWQDMLAGFRYMRNLKGLMTIAGMAIVLNFFLTPGFSTLPLLVKDYFGGDAIQLSGVNSAVGIGVILGGLTLSVWGGFKRRIFTTLSGLAGLGVGTLVIGLAPPTGIVWAIAAAFIVGVMQPITNGPIMAIMQSVVSPDMQGRTFTLLMSISAGMSPIGLLIAGPVSDTLGIQTWFILGGVTCILMAGFSLFLPSVLNIENEQHSQVVAQPVAGD